LVDWIKLGPGRDLVATGNRLAFSLAPAGTEDTTIVGSGFSPATVPVDIYDVTDPGNVLLQQLTAAGGGVSFNRTLAVTRTFELVTDASRLSPQSIEGDNVPSPLLSDDDANQADMIIITDPSLDSALTPLRAKRAAQGLIVKTVFVQDIFDEFNFGLYSTEAIRDFLGYAYASWSGTPAEYVLLAGEGSYDHRDVKGENGPGGNLVPVFLRSGIDSNLGEAASDNQYVDFDGDDLADMLLGRLPARDPAELTIMVQKIVTYESQPTTAPWRARHLFISDNGLVPPECDPDPASNFFVVVNEFISDYFPENHLLYRLFYAPTDCYADDPEPHYVPTIGQMQTRIVQMLNPGNQFVIYTGHGQTQGWGHEDFFNIGLIGGVNNGDKTPVMLPMTCLVGIYHYPDDYLSESLLKSATGGSVASYTPTGFQVQKGHDYLLEGFYSGVFLDGDRILGQAVYKAKLNLDSGPGYFQDLHDTYMLLGDPAMRIDMPDSVEMSFLPVTMD
jgi:hypothetical protein